MRRTPIINFPYGRRPKINSLGFITQAETWSKGITAKPTSLRDKYFVPGTNTLIVEAKKEQSKIQQASMNAQLQQQKALQSQAAAAMARAEADKAAAIAKREEILLQQERRAAELRRAQNELEKTIKRAEIQKTSAIRQSLNEPSIQSSAEWAAQIAANRIQQTGAPVAVGARSTVPAAFDDTSTSTAQETNVSQPKSNSTLPLLIFSGAVALLSGVL